MNIIKGQRCPEYNPYNEYNTIVCCIRALYTHNGTIEASLMPFQTRRYQERTPTTRRRSHHHSRPRCRRRRRIRITLCIFEQTLLSLLLLVDGVATPSAGTCVGNRG